ncbi:hypothetical protein GJ744_000997 [Endocarpon pusillum]|uniref:Uncharacterized protein n=1 Tax=Endocarpon pusillum TaxID=364733 RepID=A0A8H7E3M4_9EURO|nr:hypothetical protein GJ744_000997 [Endocarpon pusillum]
MAAIANKIEVQKGSKKDKGDDKVSDRAKQEAKRDDAEDINADEEQTFASLGKAADQLLRVKDIRDELNMLKSVVKQQKKAWDELISVNPGNILSPTDYTIEHIEEMEKAAFRIQEAILAVMGLEQNEASINEAVSSRKQTGETIEEGKTLMVFTVITIIFLPLSFLASLFALNIGEFPHTSGGVKPGTLQYKASWIFPIIFGVTAGIFFIAIAIGLHGPLLRFWRELVRSILPGSYGSGHDHNVAGSSSTSGETSLALEKPEKVGISNITHRSLLSWRGDETVGGRRGSTVRHHYHHVRGGRQKALSQHLDEEKGVPGTISRIGATFRRKDQTKGE